MDSIENQNLLEGNIQLIFGSMVILNVRIIIGESDTIKSGPVTGGGLKGPGTREKSNIIA